MKPEIKNPTQRTTAPRLIFFWFYFSCFFLFFCLCSCMRVGRGSYATLMQVPVAILNFLHNVNVDYGRSPNNLGQSRKVVTISILILKVLKCSLEPPEQYPVGGIKSFFGLTKCELKNVEKGSFFGTFSTFFDSVAQNFCLNRTKTYINARHNKNREKQALTVSCST